jgi:hypothetical protein
MSLECLEFGVLKVYIKVLFKALEVLQTLF